MFCAKHKLKGMIDVRSSHCIHPNCKRQSIYNVPNEKARYCSIHKNKDMINVKRVSKPKTCIYTNCKKNPKFNMPNKKGGLYCFEHKLNGMIDIKTKKCIHSECKKYPRFNNPNKKGGLYCFEHKLKSMINVVERPCTTPLCSTLGLKKYNGHCLYCYVHLFPFSPLSRNFKTKEASVVEFVKVTFPNCSWITDKRIQDGCSKRRPDIFLDLGDQVIIVEVDENQHMNYDCSCENKRLMELSQDVGHRPIVFIRFNPDSYISDEKKVTSCWCLNEIGLCIIKKKREWEQRLEALKQQIEYWMKERTTKMVEVIQLFY
jgi:hypothetical protein